MDNSKSPTFYHSVLQLLSPATLKTTSHLEGSWGTLSKPYAAGTKSFAVIVCFNYNGFPEILLKHPMQLYYFTEQTLRFIRLTEFIFVDTPKALDMVNNEEYYMFPIAKELLVDMLHHPTASGSVILHNLNRDLKVDALELLPKQVREIRMHNCNLEKFPNLNRWLRSHVLERKLTFLHMDGCKWNFGSSPVISEILSNPLMSLFINNTEMDIAPRPAILRCLLINEVTHESNGRFVYISPNPWSHYEYQLVCTNIFRKQKSGGKFKQKFFNGLIVEINPDHLSVNHALCKTYKEELAEYKIWCEKVKEMKLKPNYITPSHAAARKAEEAVKAEVKAEDSKPQKSFQEAMKIPEPQKTNGKPVPNGKNATTRKKPSKMDRSKSPEPDIMIDLREPEAAKPSGGIPWEKFKNVHIVPVNDVAQAYSEAYRNAPETDHSITHPNGVKTVRVGKKITIDLRNYVPKSEV
ncbi:hypothetical protein L596_013806 [Steinernema carpocapsae]|uniref:Uncharacterized protein n=1 Tax=Steinernema carpocapsae TaxID=34508 RepID=A0A4U5P1E6_STECR|nr:hypothetical protein L596_013806 [Steinernema carpocapsae]